MGTRVIFRVPAALVFQQALVQPLVANDQAMGDADAFHVREHEAGAFVPVVEEDLDAGGGQFLVEDLGGLAYPVGFGVASWAAGRPGRGRWAPAR